MPSVTPIRFFYVLLIIIIIILLLFSMSVAVAVAIILYLVLCRMVQLLKPGRKAYVDLTVSLSTEEDDDIPGPPIRYFFT